MIKALLFSMAIGYAILIAPDWKPPYTTAENWLMLVGLVTLMGPPFLLLILLLNWLVNISFLLPGGRGRHNRSG